MCRNSEVDKNIQHVKKNIVQNKKCNPIKVVTVIWRKENF